jgi:hypothetical protein
MLSEGQAVTVRRSQLGTEYVADRVRYCPLCARELAADLSAVQEYWAGTDYYVDLFCGNCKVHLTLVFTDKVITFEPAGNPHLDG